MSSRGESWETDSGSEFTAEMAQAVDDYIEARRAGENPSLSQLIDRFADHADTIRDVVRMRDQLADLRNGAEPASAVSADDPGIPEKLGHFEIVRKIGRGGMGIVYEAIDVRLEKRVALKVLSVPKLDAQSREMFVGEARALAKLEHPNIVPVFDVGEAEGVHYFCMQLIRGQPLDRVLDDVRVLRGESAPESGDSGDFTGTAAHTMTLGRVRLEGDADSSQEPHGLTDSSLVVGGNYYRNLARIGLQVAEALAFSHSQNIVHRDIKPSNLILDPDGHVWVTDFGLAKWLDPDRDPEVTTDVFGTLQYMAPERLDGEDDKRCDVYSIGATLYELVALRPPFYQWRSRRWELAARIREGHPEPLERLDPGVPSDLRWIVAKATARFRNDRYGSAQELADNLRCFVEGRPLLDRKSGFLERVIKWVRRHPTAAVLAVVSLLAVLASTLGAVWYSAWQSERESLAAAQNEVAERENRVGRIFYSASMQEAASVSRRGLVVQTRRILESLEPDPGEADRRGIEWEFLWAHSKPAEDRLLGHASPINDVKFSPDGKLLASCGGDGVRIWDLENRRQVARFLDESCTIVEFSDDGRLAAGGHYGTVWVWELSDLELIHELKGHDLPITSIQFVPGEKSQLLSTSGHWMVRANTGELRHWNLDSGESRQEKFDRGVWNVECLSSSEIILATEKDVLRRDRWPPGNVEKLPIPGALDIELDAEKTLALSNNSRLLDLKTGRVRQLDLGDSSKRITLSPDGKLAYAEVSVNKATAVRIVNVADNRVVARLGYHSGRIRGLAVSPDGSTLATASNDRSIGLWNARSRSDVPKIPVMNLTEAVTSIASSADDRVLAIATHDGNVGLYRRGSRYPYAMTSIGDPVEAWLDFTTDGRLVMGGSFRYDPRGTRDVGRLIVWDPDGDPERQTLVDVKVRLTSAAGGGWIVASHGGVVDVWDEKLNPIAQLKGLGWRMVAISPTGRWLAVDDRGGPRLYATEDWSEIYQFERRELASARQLTFSPDGRWLARVDLEGELIVWSLRTGRIELSRICEHQLWSLAFSPDSRRLAFAGNTLHSDICILDTSSWLEVARFQYHNGQVPTLQFLRDGKTLISGGYDRRVIFWTGEPDGVFKE